MPRCLLTRSVVRGARPTGRGWSTYWDTSLRGLGLRVRPSGRRSWVIAYRTRAGQKGFATLGHPPEVSLREARRLALQALAEVARGGNPGAERRRARRAPRFADLAAAYLERRSRPHKRSWREDQRRVVKYLLPEFGAERAVAVTRPEVTALHRAIGARSHPEANRVIDLLGAIYGWGEREGLLPEAHPNPARGIRRFPAVRRERWLSPQEVGRIARAVDAEPSTHLRALFWTLLLCGVRKRELLGLRWSDLDLEGERLRVPGEAGAAPEPVLLSRPALAILEALPRSSGTPFTFPSPARSGAPVSQRTVERAWRRILAASGVADARIHDLGRTVRCWLARGGTGLDPVGPPTSGPHAPRAAPRSPPVAEGARRVALERHAEALLAAIGAEAARDR